MPGNAFGLGALALSALLAWAPCAFADEAAAGPDPAAQLEQRIADARARLALTDEQAAKVEPILRAGLEAQRAVMEKHGLDPSARGGARERLGLRAARRLRGDMDAARGKTLEALAEVLTPEQLETYREIQEEGRREMRGRLRANR